MTDNKLTETSICKDCFHSYVCEQFNEHRECDNKRCHFANDHFVPADLINRLQAENERLCQINGTLLSDGSKIFQEIEIVKAENERLEKENKHYAELEQGCYVTGVKNIKAEAYKECIEKAKSEIDRQSHSRSLEASGERFRIHKILDNLLKELVGE